MNSERPLAKGEPKDRDATRDPLSGAPGARPVGTGVGLAGKGIVERVDPTAEEAYWKQAYSNRPYYDAAWSYDDYSPAYQYALNSYERYPGKSFDEIEADLGQGWDQARGSSRLTWDRAKEATRVAWHRLTHAVERAIPGDSDHDGR